MTNKFRKDELLKVLTAWAPSNERLTKYGKECKKQIVALIKKPKITEEFVEEWVDKFDGIAQQGLIIDIDLVRQMLTEAGYQIRAKVTEEWIEEKAKGLITMVADLYPHEGSPCVIPKSKAKDFICSLVKKASNG